MHVFVKLLYLCVYRLEVRAYNPGSRHKYNTAVVRIQVTDVNDNAPFFPTYRPLFVHEGLSISTGSMSMYVVLELYGVYRLYIHRMILTLLVGSFDPLNLSPI